MNCWMRPELTARLSGEFIGGLSCHYRHQRLLCWLFFQLCGAGMTFYGRWSFWLILTNLRCRWVFSRSKIRLLTYDFQQFSNNTFKIQTQFDQLVKNFRAKFNEKVLKHQPFPMHLCCLVIYVSLLNYICHGRLICLAPLVGTEYALKIFIYFYCDVNMFC